MLTRRQKDLLDYLERYAAAEGICPSFEEIAGELKLGSKSSVHRLVSGLEERGFIRRIKFRARAIELLPRDITYVTCEHCGRMTATRPRRKKDIH